MQKRKKRLWSLDSRLHETTFWSIRHLLLMEQRQTCPWGNANGICQSCAIKRSTYSARAALAPGVPSQKMKKWKNELEYLDESCISCLSAYSHHLSFILSLSHSHQTKLEIVWKAEKLMKSLECLLCARNGCLPRLPCNERNEHISKTWDVCKACCGRLCDNWIKRLGSMESRNVCKFEIHWNTVYTDEWGKISPGVIPNSVRGTMQAKKICAHVFFQF